MHVRIRTCLLYLSHQPSSLGSWASSSSTTARTHSQYNVSRRGPAWRTWFRAGSQVGNEYRPLAEAPDHVDLSAERSIFFASAATRTNLKPRRNSFREKRTPSTADEWGSRARCAASLRTLRVDAAVRRRISTGSSSAAEYFGVLAAEERAGRRRGRGKLERERSARNRCVDQRRRNCWRSAVSAHRGANCGDRTDIVGLHRSALLKVRCGEDS